MDRSAAVWSGSTLFVEETSKTFQQMTNQMTNKAPIKTAADNNFCDIFLNFQKKGTIFHENSLPADDSDETSYLIC